MPDRADELARGLIRCKHNETRACAWCIARAIRKREREVLNDAEFCVRNSRTVGYAVDAICALAPKETDDE